LTNRGLPPSKIREQLIDLFDEDKVFGVFPHMKEIQEAEKRGERV